MVDLEKFMRLAKEAGFEIIKNPTEEEKNNMKIILQNAFDEIKLLNNKDKNKLILSEIQNKFPNVKFKIIENKYNLEILYSDKVYIDNEEFYEVIYEIMKRYMDTEQLLKSAIVYDWLRQIDNE